MKKTIIISVLALASFLTTPVNAAGFADRICEYVQVDDKPRLKSYLRQSKLKIVTIYDATKCSGDNLLIFAAKNKSFEVGEYIIDILPHKKVRTQVDKMRKHSLHLAEEAKYK